MKKPKIIHFVGIKGVGMTPLAIIAKEAGCKVTGSDVGEIFITDEPLRKAGLQPFVGFSKEHVSDDIDLTVTTGAHGGFDNEEVLAAKKKGILVMTQGEAVGAFMDGKILGRKFDGVSVAGSHGKTTTTAIVATILKECGLDPSFLLGTSNAPSLGMPGHLGKGKYFVAEADEYATEPVYDKTPKFLWQHPSIAIITNIELDHPDLYPTVDDIRVAFLTFAEQLPSNGILIVNGDDSQVRKLLERYSGVVVTFGRGRENDFMLTKISVSGSQTFFWVETKQASLGEFVISVAGYHNAFNALAAIISGIEVGLRIEAIKKALPKFAGTKRRSEFIGRLVSGALVFDDYAHHPTEIKKTLLTFRQSFPKSKIICVFQPHTYSRTKTLFDDFIYSFSDADEVIISNIYPSLREMIDPNYSSQRLVDALKKIRKNILFLPELTDVVEYIDKQSFPSNTVIVTMGAGDIYKVSNALKMSNGSL